MPRLTKRTIDALRPAEKERFVWDSDVKGFGVRVSPRGRKTFVIQYRTCGRTRRFKLGRYGIITPDDARAMARANLGDIVKGADPSGVRQTQRQLPTVAKVCERFISEYAEVRLKPPTIKAYREYCDRFIIPTFGPMRIQDVTRADVSAFHLSLKDTPYQANRVLAAISKIFNTAEFWELRPDGSNPTRHVQKYKEQPRQRFLSPDEVKRLLHVLDECEATGQETVFVVAAFKLLLFTGCRLSEIRKLKWSYVQGDAIFLPDAKAGPRRVLLSASALHVLEHVRARSNCTYVIAGTLPDAPMNDMQKPWRRIRARAGLEDVRIHDLRHTYAAISAMAGHSLPMIGRLLGHTQAQTTARYAHLADTSARKALGEIDAMMNSFVGS